MKLLGSRSKALCAAAVAAFVLPAAAFADVVVTVNFSGTTVGSATYTNAGDLEPVTCTFTHGADTWTCADTIDFPFITQWAGATATEINPGITNGNSCALDIWSAENYTAGINVPGPCLEAPEAGTYTLHTPDVDGVPAMSSVGIALLYGVLGLVGYRRLRG